MNTRISSLLVFLLLLAVSPAVFADSFTVSGAPDGAPGTTYVVTTTFNGGTSYDVTYKITFSSFAGGTGGGGSAAYLKAISFQAFQPTPSSGTLNSVTQTVGAITTSLTSAWGTNIVFGSQTNQSGGGGCSGGMTGSTCTQATPVAISVPSTGMIIFDFTINDGGTVNSAGGFSIKALYETAPSGGSVYAQVSQDAKVVTSTVPEPASLALLGSGLLGVGGVIRRRISIAR